MQDMKHALLCLLYSYFKFDRIDAFKIVTNLWNFQWGDVTNITEQSQKIMLASFLYVNVWSLLCIKKETSRQEMMHIWFPLQCLLFNEKYVFLNLQVVVVFGRVNTFGKWRNVKYFLYFCKRKGLSVILTRTSWISSTSIGFHHLQMLLVISIFFNANIY